VPVTECEILRPGTGVVADFGKCILFEAEPISIAVGTIGNQFVMNEVSILAEWRGALVVSRPSAVVVVDLS
jgi:hypothetical protein